MAKPNKKALVLFAAGFEEIEFVTIVDVLRRAGVEVTAAATTPGLVRGANGISVEADRAVRGLSARDFDAVILPGGMANARTLAADADCQRIIQEARRGDLLVAAICAAPIALASAGVLGKSRITSHPSVREQLPNTTYCDERVVSDGKLLTSRGPGTAMEFALALVEQLAGKVKAGEVAAPMLAR